MLSNGNVRQTCIYRLPPGTWLDGTANFTQRPSMPTKYLSCYSELELSPMLDRDEDAA